jgi:2-amino-4-hydroxy-6-hydroxymethyldihydropteridine diphosphokinase
MVTVFVSIGSNVERHKNIVSCLQALRNQFGELQVSSVYENEAVGFAGDNFYNLVAGFQTDLPAQELAPVFREIESEHGRVRGGERFSSRTLDVDLLLYGDQVLKDEGLDVPRDEITRYAFVLRPLAELVPDLRHPELHKTMQELWCDFEPKQEMTVVDLGVA